MRRSVGDLAVSQREDKEAMLRKIVDLLVEEDIPIEKLASTVRGMQGRSRTNTMEEAWIAFDEEEAAESSWTTDVTDFPSEFVVIEKSRKPRADKAGGGTLARGKTPSRSGSCTKSRSNSLSRKSDKAINAKPPSAQRRSSSTQRSVSSDRRRSQMEIHANRPTSRTRTRPTTTTSPIAIISPSRRDGPSERVRQSSTPQKEVPMKYLQINGVITMYPIPAPPRKKRSSLRSLGRQSPRRRSQCLVHQSRTSQTRLASLVGADHHECYHALSDCSLDMTISTKSDTLSNTSNSEAAKQPTSSYLRRKESDLDEPLHVRLSHQPSSEDEDEDFFCMLRKWEENNHSSFSEMEWEESQLAHSPNRSKKVSFTRQGNQVDRACVRRLTPQRLDHDDEEETLSCDDSQSSHSDLEISDSDSESSHDCEEYVKPSTSPRSMVKRPQLHILGDYRQETVAANQRPMESAEEPVVMSFRPQARSCRDQPTDSDDADIWRLQQINESQFINKRISPRRSTRASCSLVTRKCETKFLQVTEDLDSICKAKRTMSKVPQKKTVSWQDLAIEHVGLI